MLSALLASAALVAFPKEGQSFPYLERVYMIGATAKGDTNVVVKGENVSVYRTGAWATVVEVTEGTNLVSVVTQRGEATNVCFRIAAKPAPGPQAPEKVWTKLEYAGDVPQDPPTNKAPAEITVTIDAGHGGDVILVGADEVADIDQQTEMQFRILNALKKSYETGCPLETPITTAQPEATPAVGKQ